MTAVSTARPSAAWRAPVAAEPVKATVPVPGSKSLTNRALILAAQATGPSLITAPLRSRDTDLMAAALRALGTGIVEVGDDWQVTPARINGPATIDCGLAGTVMRFVPALAATATGTITLDGDEAARRRPMATVLDALRALGADIDGDTLPFTIHGTGAVRGGTVRIDASASSQFVSGLLLAARVVHRGRPGGPRRGRGPVPAAHRDDGADPAVGGGDGRRFAARRMAGRTRAGVAVDDRHRTRSVQRHARFWRPPPSPVELSQFRTGRPGPTRPATPFGAS